ncbi:beta-N-acetylhexosaminidase [Herbiconiux sp.]|uniref:beta-N-acetylhexosaminidase n=1 Tax=Herbiconiux sp. TaxID=1871186 RepID=UPI0025C182BB|nr:beta-N-acetylhexosaminidase [Herbiconiux sp.]
MSRRDILGTLLPGFEGTVLPAWVDGLLREGLGGVCLFGENVVDTTQLRELTDAIRAANPDAVIAIDEEGGDVTRLYYDRGAPFPGNAVLGRIDDVAATRAVGAAVGAELRAVGVNLDLAPDVDINSNPLNPVIGVRSFGAAPGLVSRHGAAWTAGLQSQGVAANLKHFPGHGDTAEDSHLALPSVDVPLEVLRARELQPFAAAIEAGALTVMTSHVLLPQVDPVQPATFSPAVLQGLLRGELGFRGVIVSDALDMVGASGTIGIPTAAVRALAAGCDLLCIGTKNTAAQLEEIHDRIAEALGSGELPVERLADATVRLRRLAEVLRGWDDSRAVGSETVPAPVPVPDAAGVAASFAMEPAAALALSGPGWVLVRVDTEPNNAIGEVPWDPSPALAAAGVDLPVFPVSTAGPIERIDHIPPAASVLVVGRDNQRRPVVVHLIDALRARHERVVTVDLGWPGDDPRYSGIATYGASALVADALAAALAERTVRA